VPLQWSRKGGDDMGVFKELLDEAKRQVFGTKKKPKPKR
jgi:hypothetical protein